MALLMDLDTSVARHLAVAIARHRVVCARDGIEVPIELVKLFDVCERTLSRPLPVTDGHVIDMAAAVPHDPGVRYEDAAAALGVSVRTVGRWVRAGRLKRVGRRVTAASIAAVAEGRPAA